MQVLEIREPFKGADVQSVILAWMNGAQLVRLFIRKGEALKRQASSVPVSLFVVSGEGAVETGGERAELKSDRLVNIGAWGSFEVKAESDLILLIFGFPPV